MLMKKSNENGNENFTSIILCVTNHRLIQRHVCFEPLRLTGRQDASLIIGIAAVVSGAWCSCSSAQLTLSAVTQVHMDADLCSFAFLLEVR